MALSRLCCSANKFLFQIPHCPNLKFQALRVPKNARNFQRFSEIGRKPAKHKLVNQEHTSGLTKPFLFSVAFCGSSMILAAICEYENKKNFIGQRAVPFYRRPRLHEMGIRERMRMYWQQLADWRKVYIPICLINCGVFCAWRIRSLQPFMKTYFLISPTSRNIYWQMMLSMFSHAHAFHILGNMVALCSSMPFAIENFGPERFWAFYLSAGVVSSLFSLAFKRVCNITIPSLGASGAVFGVISYICYANPNIRVNFFFLPFLSFNALSIIKANLCFDIFGCIMRWKLLDHAAHIGGVLFGMTWWLYLENKLWPFRAKVVSYWKRIRPGMD